ncbi:class IV lanthionine synthetase LanL [Streptomyces sp. NPDC056485]|uniref:class IV lanthionine synthetase LanL n=1 Tax=Streptomyces sp. NPDC056485 TaxID=3345834 RepID=UPI0036A0D2E2
MARAVLDRCRGQRWAFQPSDAWCFVRPPETVRRAHGWKLHVSATPLAAPVVLARSAEVLVRHGASFKFATDLDRVARLGNIWSDRGSGGKFITVYPRDDDHFRMLAFELDAATAGLPGPRILSDRQLVPGSLVYFRYGEFSGERFLSDDGVFERRMTGPDGSVVKDERKPGFVLPPWAAYPFPEEPAPTVAAPASVLLGGRFRVLRAIRHANKGGVYRAVDEHTGAEVVVKHARAHVGARLDGSDVRDRLRNEARMLERLAPLAVSPAVVDLFEEQGDLFLAEELVPGTPLNLWQAERAGRAALTRSEAVAMARGLVALLRTVHQAGLVVCDFKPHNVVVTPSGEVRLIDTEYVAEPGQERVPAYTAGFAAPEARAAGAPDGSSRPVPVPGPAADRFSLGVTLFCLVTDLDSRWAAGRPDVVRPREDPARLFSLIARSHPLLEPFSALIAGLVRSDPEDRWTLGRAEEYLLGLSRTPGTPGGAEAGPGSVPAPKAAAPLYREVAVERLLADGLLHLRRSMTPHRDTLWPRPERRVAQTDPCNTWNGAAGVLATLTRAARADGGDSLRETVAAAAAWIDERLFAVPRLLPGLCFGRSGTAWALYDAARFLDDTKTADRAVELARRLPVRWHSPDFTHGLAGAGTAHLHLWHLTNDEAPLDAALACGDAVLAAADRGDGQWIWPTSTATDSELAGMRSYGFAHGTAGVGTFLLSAAHAAQIRGLPEPAARFMEAALGAGATLVETAHTERGRATWPARAGGEPQPRPTTQWCNGPAGIGTFLIRLWAATGEERFAELAEQAAATAMSDPWRAGPGACCGNAGTGHLLLDLAELRGTRRHRVLAEEIAGIIDAQHSVQDGLRLTADRAGGCEYANGAAGILDFLLRLRHGGPRPWTAPTPLRGFS